MTKKISENQEKDNFKKETKNEKKEREKKEKALQEEIRAENERLEKEKVKENEKAKRKEEKLAKKEKVRLEKEKEDVEKARIEKEKADQEQARLEKEKADEEEMEKRRIEKMKGEKIRFEKEKAEEENRIRLVEEMNAKKLKVSEDRLKEEKKNENKSKKIKLKKEENINVSEINNTKLKKKDKISKIDVNSLDNDFNVEEIGNQINDYENPNPQIDKNVKEENTYYDHFLFQNLISQNNLLALAKNKNNKRRSQEVLDISASDFNLTKSDFSEETADVLARRNKDGRKETIIQNRALKEIKKRLRTKEQKVKVVDVENIENDISTQASKRYSQRVRIPKLNLFAGERIIYKVDKQTKCLKAVSVMIVNAVKLAADRHNIQNFIHQEAKRKLKKKHLVKRSEKLESEGKEILDILDKKVKLDTKKLLIIGPRTEKSEDKNFDVHFRCELVNPSDKFLISIEDDESYTESNLVKGECFEILPLQIYRISNLSFKKDLIIKFNIM